MEEVKLNQIQVRTNTIVTTACRYYNNKEEKEAGIAKKRAEGKLISLAEDKNLPFHFHRNAIGGRVAVKPQWGGGGTLKMFLQKPVNIISTITTSVPPTPSAY